LEKMVEETKTSLRNEPEITRARARIYVASCNATKRKPYGTKIYRALELAQQAHEALGLHYDPGLGAMERYPPDRFTWVFAEDGDARERVRVRDDKTGRTVVWPHLFG
jgi:hypothetical protein